MPDIEDLLAKARALGEALAAHPTVHAYYAAQRAVRNDASAQTLLHDYQTLAARIRQLEADQKPIEVADKHKLRDLETSMATHAAMKELMRAQADYAQLMAQVNQATDAPLVELAKPEKSA